MQEQLSESSRFPWTHWLPLQPHEPPGKEKGSYFQGKTSAHSAPTLSPLTPSAEQKSKNNAACWNLEAESRASPRLHSSNTEGSCGRCLGGGFMVVVCCCCLCQQKLVGLGLKSVQSGELFGPVLSWRNNHCYFGHLKLLAKVYRKKNDTTNTNKTLRATNKAMNPDGPTYKKKKSWFQPVPFPGGCFTNHTT